MTKMTKLSKEMVTLHAQIISMLTAKKVKNQREAREMMFYISGTTSHSKDLLPLD
jgi:hypothetical protein